MPRRLFLFSLAALGLLLGPAHAQSPDARVIRGDLAVSDDGTTVATSTGTGTLLLWNADTWALARRHTADGSLVFGFDFSPDGRYVAGMQILPAGDTVYLVDPDRDGVLPRLVHGAFVN
jgi:WD40 repeat protein